MKKEIKEMTLEWIKEAEEDLKFAKEIFERYPKKSAFFAQQAAEKYLKAFLCFHNAEIIKRHEIELLIIACSRIDKEFEKLLETKAPLLTKYYKTRYPPSLISVEKEDAKEAIEIAEKIKEFVLKKLKI